MCLWLLDIGDSEIVLKEFILVYLIIYSIILFVFLRKGMKYDVRV